MAVNVRATTGNNLDIDFVEPAQFPTPLGGANGPYTSHNRSLDAIRVENHTLALFVHARHFRNPPKLLVRPQGYFSLCFHRYQAMDTAEKLRCHDDTVNLPGVLWLFLPEPT